MQFSRITSCCLSISFAGFFLLFWTTKRSPFFCPPESWIYSLLRLSHSVPCVSCIPGMPKCSSPALIPFQAPHSDLTLYSLAPCRWLIGASHLICSKKNSWFHSRFAPAPNLSLSSLLSHDKWHHYSSTFYKPKSLFPHTSTASQSANCVSSTLKIHS